MARILMFIEQRQHFCSRYLDYLHQEIDPFGTSTGVSEVPNKISPKHAGENLTEVLQADDEDNASSPQRHQIKSTDEGENSTEESQEAVGDSASSTKRHQSKSVDDGKNSAEVSNAAKEDNVCSQRHQSKSVDEDENSAEVTKAAEEDIATSPQRHQSKSIDKEPITSRIRMLLERLQHLLSGFLIYRRRQNTDVSKMPENATVVQAERATVQLFSSHSGNLIEDIEGKLIELLTKELSKQLNYVNFVKCNQLQVIDSEKMLIVLSIISSRTGADAAYAIRGINNPGNTVLLLIHNKEPHALPTQRSSLILTDRQFRNLRGIFDVAFTTEKGFYNCDMNSRDITSLVHEVCRL